MAICCCISAQATSLAGSSVETLLELGSWAAVLGSGGAWLGPWRCAELFVRSVDARVDAAPTYAGRLPYEDKSIGLVVWLVRVLLSSGSTASSRAAMVPPFPPRPPPPELTPWCALFSLFLPCVDAGGSLRRWGHSGARDGQPSQAPSFG